MRLMALRRITSCKRPREERLFTRVVLPCDAGLQPFAIRAGCVRIGETCDSRRSSSKSSRRGLRTHVPEGLILWAVAVGFSDPLAVFAQCGEGVGAGDEGVADDENIRAEAGGF